MRTAYKVLAYIIAAEVALQAMFMVYGDAGLGKWIDGGGVLDKAVLESGASPFPEVIGFILHGMNGMLVIPAVALALLIVSFFAGVPGGVKWAGVVLGLVVLQVTLGLLGHSVPTLGALHGVNALALFTTAAYTARRARSDEAADRLAAATS
jgi:heme A synthase